MTISEQVCWLTPFSEQSNSGGGSTRNFWLRLYRPVLSLDHPQKQMPLAILNRKGHLPGISYISTYLFPCWLEQQLPIGLICVYFMHDA